MARVIEHVGSWLMWQRWRLTHPYDVVLARRYAAKMKRADEEWARG